jgi:hypothetical protein
MILRIIKDSLEIEQEIMIENALLVCLKMIPILILTNP